MKKLAKVHLLPTDKTSNILVNTYINETHSASRFVMSVTKDTLDQIPVQAVELRGYKYQHLYITTDDEIKEGDWYIDEINMVRQSVTSDKEYWSVRPDYRKIIATTDPKLHSTRLKDCPINPEDNMVSVRGVSKPSKEFIEEYCKAGGIDEVDVEYGLFHDGNFKDDNETHAFKAIRKPKVTSNNEIIIHSIEEKMYSESEREQIKSDYYDGGEILHHKDCFFYPESIATQYDQLREAAEKVVEFRKQRLDGSMYQAIEQLAKALK